MKLKSFILLFIFGLFIFLLPSFAEAACQLACYDSSFVGYSCKWVHSTDWSDGLCSCGWERLGLIGSASYTNVPSTYYMCESGNCANSGTTYSNCKADAFPIGYDGATCTAIDGDWSFPNNCTECVKSGHWDASQSKCVECSGKTENRILGNTSSVGDVCNDNFPAGDGKCESACGASSACDEFSPGQQGNCPSGQKCNNSCQCETSAQTCSAACTSAGYDNGLCFYGSTSCSAQGYPYSYNQYCHHNCSLKSGTSCDGTCLCFDTDSNKPTCTYYSSGSTCYYNGFTTCTNSGWSSCSYSTCSLCSGKKTYDCTASGCSNLRCKKNSCGADCAVDSDCPSGSTCQSDCTCSGVCSGDIDVYPEDDTEPCDYTIDIYNVDNCQGKTWRVERNGSYVSSGTVGSNTDWSKTLYDDDLDADSYEYVLKIDGDEKDYDSVNCSSAAYTLSVNSSPIAGISISGSPSTYSGTTNYQKTNISAGTSLSLTAPATYSSYSFSSWSGCNSVGGTGNRTCYLTMNSNKNVTANFTSAANNPPTCNYLSASPTSGNLPLNVSFTGSGSDSDGTIAQYEFDFGDGSAKVYSGTAGTTHTYNAVGTYCAKLRVKDNEGAWSTNTGNCPGGTCTTQVTVTEAGAAISPPGVATNAATGIAQTSAVLNGTLNDMGGAASCLVWFKWGPTTAMANSTPVQTKTSTGSFSANISGLTSGQTYYFEAFAKNGGSW